MSGLDFGVVLQNDPPAQRVVDLARRAEAHGFSHAWTFDSHVLWQEPYVTYAAILAATHRITVGPMVTNPATRDATVTASLFATLNETYGNRTVCGIGRGDSAVRVGGGRPTTLAALRECVRVVRELANGRSVGVTSPDGASTELRFPWVSSSQLQVWVAAYGPKALALTGEVADGFILQLADPAIAAWMVRAVREAAERAGRDPASLAFCVAAPAYVGAGRDGTGSGAALAHQREQCRWFGGMVGNHVADIVARYGSDGGADGASVPRALTDYIAARQGYDYAEHGRAGNTHTAFVPDDVVDRFCVLGRPEDHVEKLLELADVGATQFALYLQHDAKGSTLDAYGEQVIPAVRAALAARAPQSPPAPATEAAAEAPPVDAVPGPVPHRAPA